jgi:hypothetical protein
LEIEEPVRGGKVTQNTAEAPAVARKLAQEVTLSPDEPDEQLERALTQLVLQVQTGEEPERPLDWASIVADAVAARHS